MKARVTVTLKTGVLDPQGKVFDIELGSADRGKAEAALTNACEKLLANTVVENYRVEIL
jgi:phosphoribosylformylglycinamidine synthase PurS subunit